MSSILTSSKYLFIGNLGSKAVSLIGTILLARILFPEDYGLILIATIITSFVQMLGNMGFENYYLQDKSDKQSEEKILFLTFVLRLGLNSFLFILQFGGTFLYSYFVEENAVVELVRFSSFGLLIDATVQINLFILRKKINYKPEVIANFSRDIIGTVTKIFFAHLGFGALSFVLGGLIGKVFRAIVLLKFQHYFPKIWSWDKDLFHKIYFFGKHSLLAGVGTFASQQIDKIILTSFFSPATVGLYHFAESQSKMIFSILIYPQGSLITSFCAKYKFQQMILFEKLSSIGYLITIVLAPILIFLYFFADSIFGLLFGDKWNDSILIFKCFLVYYFLTEVTFPFSTILTSFGMPQIASKLVLIRLVILSVSLLVSVNVTDNIFYYFFVFAFISFIFSWVKLSICLKLLNKTLYDYLIYLKPSLIFILFYVSVGFLVANLDINSPLKFLICFILYFFSSVVLHILVFKVETLRTIKLFLSENQKVYVFFKRIIS